MADTGAVAAGHPATADAGAAILRQGGNAVDAAIAAVCVSFTSEPVLTGAGGGGFMLIADARDHAMLYDGFARMPSGNIDAITPELKEIPIDFGDAIQSFHIGQASVATPSLMSMLVSAHDRHGRLPLGEALAPAIDAARHGIRLNQLQSSFLKLLHPILTDTHGAASLFAPERKGHEFGELLQEGEYFLNPDLANTLEMLSIDGIREMFHGDLARAIVRACHPAGLLNMHDMRRGGQVRACSPLRVRAMGGELLTNPPPSSGGLLIAYATMLVDRLSGQSDTPMPVLMAECLRCASILRDNGFDKGIYDHDIEQKVLAAEGIEAALEHIRLRLAGKSGPTAPEPANRHGSTTHVSIIDRDGMAVSVTSSNGEGSGIVVPGAGIHLNNMLGEEDINPLGFHALPAGARLSSMMAPSIFIKDRRVSMILGSGGSNRLRGAILQTLARCRLLGQDIETAVPSPRMHNESSVLDVEPGLLSGHERARLTALGWDIKTWQNRSIYFGGVHAIAVDSRGNIHAAGDPRRGGAVARA